MKNKGIDNTVSSIKVTAPEKFLCSAHQIAGGDKINLKLLSSLSCWSPVFFFFPVIDEVIFIVLSEYRNVQFQLYFGL